MDSRAVKVSVILCTYNPRQDLIAWALASLDRQTLPKDQFELVIIDNNSRPALQMDTLRGRRNLHFRLIREPRQGLTYARVTGILATEAPLLVFVDDDNYLDPDYLEQALALAAENPGIGCFGGKVRAVLESPIAAWKHPLLGYLGVRDYGAEPITSTNRVWGKWEPIGAGMVCRRDVANAFVEWVERDRLATQLGRSGSKLMSGEDTLLAQAAYRRSYACSYQPELKLSHWMKPARLRASVLARTLIGHGRSQVTLQRLQGTCVPRTRLRDFFPRLFRCYLKRVDENGFGEGTIKWFWDWGYHSQSRRIE